MESFNPSPEQLKDVKLRVVPPNRDKRFMIGFEGHTQEQANAFNDAVYDVLSENELSPFHQVGHERDPGYSAWEIWGEADQSQLEGLLPLITIRAEENIGLYKSDQPL